MPRGEITKKLLEAIANTAGGASDVMGAFLSAGYGASYSQIEYERQKRFRARENAALQRGEEMRRRQRYYLMISYLKRDGLIREYNKGNRKFFASTRKGNQWLALFHKRTKDRLPEPSYKTHPSGGVTIVIFDVPERERKKRAWLRLALKHLGLKMIQQSVWMGRVSVPKELLDDIDRLHLGEYVEIFQVTKSGTLKL